MRILVIHDDANEQGGANVYRKELSNLLQNRGVKVFLFTYNIGPDENSERSFCYRYGRNIRYFRHVSHNYFNPALFIVLKKYIQKIQPDIIHIHNNKFFTNTVLLALNNKIPTVQTLHDYQLICPTYKGHTPSGRRCDNTFGLNCYLSECISLKEFLLGYASRCLQKLLINKRDVLFLVPSEDLKNKIQMCGFKATLLPNYIDVTQYDTNEFYPLKDRILFVGRLIEDKGIGTLLDAFRIVLNKIPAASLELAGNGAAEQKYLKVVNTMQMEGKVIFYGDVRHNRIPEFYKNATLVVLPATSLENSPLVILEAMAAERPVIGSRIGGIPELIVDGKNGYLCRPGDPADLADRIIHLLSNKDKAKEMGLQGKNMVVSNYNTEKHLKKYFHVLEELQPNMKIAYNQPSKY